MKSELANKAFLRSSSRRHADSQFRRYERAIQFFSETLSLARNVQSSQAAWSTTHLNLGHAYRKLEYVLRLDYLGPPGLTQAFAHIQAIRRSASILPQSHRSRSASCRSLQRSRDRRAQTRKLPGIDSSLSRSESRAMICAILCCQAVLTTPTAIRHCKVSRAGTGRSRDVRFASARPRRRFFADQREILPFPGSSASHHRRY